jgi:hypothetical protein
MQLPNISTDSTKKKLLQFTAGVNGSFFFFFFIFLKEKKASFPLVSACPCSPQGKWERALLLCILLLVSRACVRHKTLYISRIRACMDMDRPKTILLRLLQYLMITKSLFQYFLVATNESFSTLPMSLLQKS